jgi:hypothetical protein
MVLKAHVDLTVEVADESSYPIVTDKSSWVLTSGIAQGDSLAIVGFLVKPYHHVQQ